MNPLDLAQQAAFAALEKKALAPLILDVRGVSDLCDVQFLCSGENDRQTRAIAEAIEERCRKMFGIRPVAVEGKRSGQWILLDYGSIMVHVFFSQLRKYYSLEELWPKAQTVAIDPRSVTKQAP